MDSKWTYKNIYELVTPVGFFSVFDGERKVAFSVIKNLFDIPYSVADEDNDTAGTISTDTNYTIAIPTEDLELKKEYKICFSAGTWKPCDGGEHRECYDTVIGDWAVGIGAYDPMDDQKFDQRYEYYKDNVDEEGKYWILDLKEYDESEFRLYSVYYTKDYNGFTFKVFEKTDYVMFDVAWVKIEKYPPEEYERALGLWLS